MTGRDHERAMLIYARLAAEAEAKQQLPGRDRFLLLTAVAATYAGWPAIAEQCRTIVLQNNPNHLIANQPTVADSLRCEENAGFYRQLERFCLFERAEHLVREMGVDVDALVGPGQTAGSVIDGWLSAFRV